MKRRHFLMGASAWWMLGTIPHASQVRAQDKYPSRPVKIVVAYAAGTVLDVWARRVADRLSKAVNQPVIVENKPGASGTLGASAVAMAAPDGYTLLYGGVTELALAPYLFPNLPYEKDKPFETITRFLSGNSILVANPGLPFKSIQELVAYAKANPGKLKGASPGTGTLSHLLLLALNRSAGIEILHVPYKSGSQALTDVMGGHIDVMFDWMTSSKGFIAAGKMRPLLVAGSKRKPLLPDVPTSAEVGWPLLDFGGWNVFVAPFGTPKTVIGYLHRELLPVLHSKDFESDAASFAADIVTSSPDDAKAFIKNERRRYAELVKITGVKLE
ncbi:MAG: Bug family tripartite tricarboxylate transporter substrate binding protein [Burkholderiales bacterium]